jgi:hypothetical protein
MIQVQGREAREGEIFPILPARPRPSAGACRWEKDGTASVTFCGQLPTNVIRAVTLAAHGFTVVMKSDR